MAEMVTDQELSKSMDESIAEDLKAIMAREADETPAPETPTEAPKDTPPLEAKEAPAKTIERVRDETGKFAKSAPGPTSSPDASATPEAPAADPDQPLTTTTGQPIDLNRAPSSWKPAAKAAWAGLPEDVRKEIYRREGDFLNGGKGLKEHADFGQQIRAKFEPYKAILAAEGATPEGAIDDYLRTSSLFRIGQPQQKLQAVFDLDKRFNCGLGAYFQQKVQEAVAQQTGQAPQAQPVSQQPAVYQDPRVDSILASFQQQEQHRAAQEQAITNEATERFISAKDEKGLPLYPFVDNVLEDMSARVSMMRKANPSLPHDDVLKQAYEAAVWANPETRAVLIKQQQAPVQTEVENLRKVEAAKRAAGANMPRRGALPSGEALGSMDETIRDTYRHLTG